MSEKLCKQKDIQRNPNLQKISEKLQELYASAGSDSLGMIFVQTRATAKSLADYLNEKLEGIDIPVKPFIGSKSSESSDGEKFLSFQDILSQMWSGLRSD